MSFGIDNLSYEDREFSPPSLFAKEANMTGEAYDEAEADYVHYWEGEAGRLVWEKRWSKALEWELPHAKWFLEGKLNASYNCLDRHVLEGKGDRVAFYFEGEPGDRRSITYRELLDEVMLAANGLLSLGIKKGDRVAIYMPMILELVVAMMACNRIGAIHSVVFAGFSAEALGRRIEDSGANLVITADGGFRKGGILELKSVVDEAVLLSEHKVENVLVVKRSGQKITMLEGRDIWWEELLAKQDKEHTALGMESEDPLFILYTSGTTGKPKGILHSTGGYLTHAISTLYNIFDIKADKDIYYCTADVGWVTGHTYAIYAPLLNGVTSVLYEGMPDVPKRGRNFEIMERYKVSVLYTAPTLIRTWMKWGREVVEEYDLSALRILGSAGEPINPEAWMWYREVIGGERCPIVDTWWQTETGGIMISPLPGVTLTKPGAAMRAIPGVSAKVVDNEGKEVARGEGGFLVITKPWPGILRGVWGSEERYRETYWSRFPGMYYAGDGAKVDKDGAIWLLGRVDDVMLVSGHNISTTEVESALVAHPRIAEAAVVGARDELTGQGIVAYVILREVDGLVEEKGLVGELREHVGKVIGGIARPKRIFVVEELPKTRSGKIMRRLLKDIAEDRSLGDATTLIDVNVLSMIKDGMNSNKSGD